MRITHVIPFFPPTDYLTGPATITPMICRHLVQRGHTVRVVTTDHGIALNAVPRDRWVEREGYRVWYASTNRLTGVPPFFAPRVRRGIADAAGDTDVFHLTVSLTVINDHARRIAKRHGIPYVLSPRGVLEPHRLKIKPIAKAAFLRLFERRVIRDAAAIHVLNDREAQALRDQGAHDGQLVTIPNAVDMGPPEVWPKRDEARRMFGIDDDAFVVLYLGRLMNVKGIDVLVEGFAQAAKQSDRLRLLVAGPEHEGQGAAAERRAEALGVADRTHWVGPVQDRRKLAAFRAADVFCLPSHSEGMPNTILEANAMGLPVLITPGCNISAADLADAGWIVDPTADAVAAGIMQAAKNPTPAASLKFTADEVVGAFERVYQQAIESRREPPPAR